MTTGNDVITAMALSASAKADATANLAAVNYALATAWPFWRISEYASGGTLASATYSYSLSTLTTIDRDAGVARVEVIPTNCPAVDISHRCRQYYDHSASAWTLQIASSVTGKYSGYPFYVGYQYRHPALAALTETVYAPIGAVARVALEWMAMYGATAQNTGNEFWKAFGAEYLRPESVWETNKSDHLEHRVRRGMGHVT